MTGLICSAPRPLWPGETRGERRGGRPQGEEVLRSGATPHLQHSGCKQTWEKDKRNDHFQGSVDHSQTERVCLEYTRGSVLTLLSVTVSLGCERLPGRCSGAPVRVPPHDNSRRSPPPGPSLPSPPAWQPRVCPVSADGRSDVSDWKKDVSRKRKLRQVSYSSQKCKTK